MDPYSEYIYVMVDKAKGKGKVYEALTWYSDSTLRSKLNNLVSKKGPLSFCDRDLLSLWRLLSKISPDQYAQWLTAGDNTLHGITVNIVCNAISRMD
jgi:hypothetical protein